jgi:hypothetical protein
MGNILGCEQCRTGLKKSPKYEQVGVFRSCEAICKRVTELAASAGGFPHSPEEQAAPGT